MATTTAFIFTQGGPDSSQKSVVSGYATIDAGETTTLAIPNHGRGVVRLGFPTMVGTTATFSVQAFPPADPAAPTLAPPFRPLYKNDGSAAVSVTVVDNSMIEVPQLSGCYAFTITSGSAETGGAAIEVQMVGEPAPFNDAGGVSPSDFAAPALTLGTTNTAGNSGKVIATNSTILAFDGTAATTLANPNTAATGSQAVAARRDHAHGVPAPGTVSTITSGASPGNGAGTGFATDTHIHGTPTLATAPTQAYKSATQTFTTNTSFADVTAASGNFAFAIAANEVWRVTYWIPLTFGGTGGAKFQITGPSSPTAVTISQNPVLYSSGAGANLIEPQARVTAFSSSIGAVNSAANTESTYNSSGTATGIWIEATIANGANAGTVTLQAAQNSSNSTTTLGVGSYMIAQKVA